MCTRLTRMAWKKKLSCFFLLIISIKFTHKSIKDAIKREIPYQVYLKRNTDRLFVKRVKKQNFCVLCQYYSFRTLSTSEKIFLNVQMFLLSYYLTSLYGLVVRIVLLCTLFQVFLIFSSQQRKIRNPNKSTHIYSFCSQTVLRIVMYRTHYPGPGPA